MLKPAFATTPILVGMCLKKGHQGPNYGAQIALAEAIADINYPGVGLPLTQTLFEKIRNAVHVTRQQRPLLQVQRRQQWLVEQPSQIGFVNTLNVKVRDFSPDRLGDFNGKVLVVEKFHAWASRRRLSANSRSASISSE